ncbi:unnamed protein product [Polarella glacialis]|uniref:Uncharacterized protein n=1 Tax=Polarella glacialis TaxID=89957 RepID=A0A813G908_POLGL|nr:unnamed protein product [Polarella glacialis]
MSLPLVGTDGAQEGAWVAVSFAVSVNPEALAEFASDAERSLADMVVGDLLEPSLEWATAKCCSVSRGPGSNPAEPGAVHAISALGDREQFFSTPGARSKVSVGGSRASPVPEGPDARRRPMRGASGLGEVGETFLQTNERLASDDLSPASWPGWQFRWLTGASPEEGEKEPASEGEEEAAGGAYGRGAEPAPEPASWFARAGTEGPERIFACSVVNIQQPTPGPGYPRFSGSFQAPSHFALSVTGSDSEA